MKPVRCSWVDMQKVRASLSGKKRGDQKAYGDMTCISKQCISERKAVVDVMGVLEQKVRICVLEHFQPSHARHLARAFRKHYGKNPEKWNVDELAEWVAFCEEHKLSVEQFDAALKKKPIVPPKADEPCCKVEDLNRVASEGVKFGCIYADPPWSYGNQGTRAATDNHYPTMTIEAIAALPIRELAADECHLHLWTTNGFLREALSLLDGWGFEFKSTFIWVKPQLGIGNYWRCSHEIMLLGVKGGRTFPANGFKSWIEADRTEHSAKPEQVRELIEKVSPGPRLELFGRRTAPGWTVWGNEVLPQGLFDPEARQIA